MKFIFIAGQSYCFGAQHDDTEADANERPQVLIDLEDFYASSHLVTIGEFRQFIEETNHTTTDQVIYFDREQGDWLMNENLSWNDPGYSYLDSTPVTCINYSDIQNYIGWYSEKNPDRSTRLLTEVEWEYAARGGVMIPRFWGNNLLDGKQFANFRIDEDAIFDDKKDFKHASPVGFFKPNPFGLYDMLGNVMEFTASDFYENPNVACNSHSNDFDELKVLKGGSFNSNSNQLRCSARIPFPGALGSNQAGFRLGHSTL